MHTLVFTIRLINPFTIGIVLLNEYCNGSNSCVFVVKKVHVGDPLEKEKLVLMDMLQGYGISFCFNFLNIFQIRLFGVR